MKKIKIIAIATICALFVMFLINNKSVNAKPNRGSINYCLAKGQSFSNEQILNFSFVMYCPYEGGEDNCAHPC